MKIYNSLYTNEYSSFNQNSPLNEYPFPQFKRDSYFSLNGIWQYKISKEINLDSINNEIIVPYPIESEASKVKTKLKDNEYIIYKKIFSLPNDFIKSKTFIHFIGVDQEYQIILNGKKYDLIVPLNLPTKIDITEAIQSNNELIVICKDNLDYRYPLGKQSRKPKGIFYTPFSGIYFPVFIESVNPNYIKEIKINTTLNTLNLNVETDALEYEVIIKNNNEIIHNAKYNKKNISILIENPNLWSFSNPHLYDLEIITNDDKITSYFGLREIKLKDGFIHLNNEKIFLNGVLDQGYFPEGIITPSSYKTVEKDILIMKELGFNTLRKHIKIEIPYFYYLCDKLGMLVFQDFVNCGKYNFFTQTALPTIGFKNKKDKNLNKNKDLRNNFIKSSEDLIKYLNNHPSIIAYTIFNEGWGQFDSENVYNHFKNLYPELIFDTASGWFRGAKTDLDSHHWYFKNLDKLKDVNHPVFISEFGALCYKLKNNCYGNDNVFGYTYFDSIEDLNKAFKDLYENKIIPYKDKLIGTIYTQITDVEEEDNGLLSYDRKILKLNKEMVQEILAKLNK